MVTSLILEDQASHSDTLKRLLASYCNDVRVLATAASVSEGLHALARFQPEVVFLDVELADGDCFELLEELGVFSFCPIFTTGHEHYALRAIKFAALDYLLKPIRISDLKSAVAKARSRIGQGTVSEKKRSRTGPNHFGKLALPGRTGYTLVDLADILRLEAQRNYTEIYFADGGQMTASRSLGEFAELSENGFFRIHDTHMVNIRHIHKYVTGKGGHVVLSDGSTVSVSVRKREALLDCLRG